MVSSRWIFLVMSSLVNMDGMADRRMFMVRVVQTNTFHGPGLVTVGLEFYGAFSLGIIKGNSA